LVGFGSQPDAIQNTPSQQHRIVLGHLFNVDWRERDVLDHGQMWEQIKTLENHSRLQSHFVQRRRFMRRQIDRLAFSPIHA
jgi:hypothetical protein